MPNLVFLTRISLQILDKTQTDVFPVSGFLIKSLLKKNFHNCHNGLNYERTPQKPTQINAKKDEISNSPMKIGSYQKKPAGSKNTRIQKFT